MRENINQLLKTIIEDTEKGIKICDTDKVNNIIIDAVASNTDTSSDTRAYMNVKKRLAEQFGMLYIPTEFCDLESLVTALTKGSTEEKENKIKAVLINREKGHKDEELVEAFDYHVRDFKAASIIKSLDKEGVIDNKHIAPVALAVARILHVILKDRDLKDIKSVAIFGVTGNTGKSISNAIKLVGLPDDCMVIGVNSTTIASVREMAYNADIIISAVGKFGMIMESRIGENTKIIVDVGCSMVDGEMVGDTMFDLAGSRINDASNPVDYIPFNAVGKLTALYAVGY